LFIAVTLQTSRGFFSGSTRSKGCATVALTFLQLESFACTNTRQKEAVRFKPQPVASSRKCSLLDVCCSHSSRRAKLMVACNRRDLSVAFLVTQPVAQSHCHCRRQSWPVALGEPAHLQTQLTSTSCSAATRSLELSLVVVVVVGRLELARKSLKSISPPNSQRRRRNKSQPERSLQLES
jgi:hypothetical protein